MKDKIFLEEIQVLSKTVTEILNIVNLFVPSTMTVSKLADSLGKDTKTIRNHLEANFIKDEDYFQKVEKGKIIIPKSTALDVAKYYTKKEAKHG